MDAFSKVHMTLHCLQWYMITGQINQCQHSHTACSHSKTGTVETLHACFLLKWSKVDGVEVRGTQEATDELLGSIVIGIVTRTQKVCR